MLVSGVLALVGCLAAMPAPAVAHHDFRFDPATGRTKTAFTAQFTADLSERRAPGGEPLDHYVLEIRGPQGCRETRSVTTGLVVAGQLVTLPVDPSNIGRPFGPTPSGARQWCPGRYTGSVRFCYCAEGDPRPEVPVGSFEFVVRGPAKYAGRTTQGKRISFRLSASGKRILRFRTSARMRCRFAGLGVQSASVPMRFGSAKVRRGRFRRREAAEALGLRAAATITGRLTHGTFRGRVRLRVSGAPLGIRTRCRSGSIRWSAR